MFPPHWYKLKAVPLTYCELKAVSGQYTEETILLMGNGRTLSYPWDLRVSLDFLICLLAVELFEVIVS